jgi:hypothetical protein
MRCALVATSALIEVDGCLGSIWRCYARFRIAPSPTRSESFARRFAGCPESGAPRCRRIDAKLVA